MATLASSSSATPRSRANTTGTQPSADIVKDVVNASTSTGPPKHLVDQVTSSMSRYKITQRVKPSGTYDELFLEKVVPFDECFEGDGDYYLCRICTLFVSGLSYRPCHPGRGITVPPRTEGVDIRSMHVANNFLVFTATREMSSGWRYTEYPGNYLVTHYAKAMSGYTNPGTEAYFLRKYGHQFRLGDFSIFERDYTIQARKWCKENPI